MDEIESTGELVRGPGDPARDRSGVPAGDSLGENVNDRAGEVERPSIAFWFFRVFGDTSLSFHYTTSVRSTTVSSISTSVSSAY